MSQAAGLAGARSQLTYLPVGLLGYVIGLTGLSVAWRMAQLRYGGPDWLAQVSPAIGWVAVATFLVVSGGYASDTVQEIEAKNPSVARELAAGRALALSTDAT